MIGMAAAIQCVPLFVEDKPCSFVALTNKLMVNPMLYAAHIYRLPPTRMFHNIHLRLSNYINTIIPYTNLTFRHLQCMQVSYSSNASHIYKL